MTAQSVKNRILELCSHFTFEYNGKECGIDPISSNSFDMWCGDDFKTVTNIDEVMNIPLFDNKSLKDIINKIEVISF